MIIKRADDKSKRERLLLSLLESQDFDGRQTGWLRDELHRLRRGLQGERDAAHYLDTHFRDAENHVVLHDVRLCDGEDTAQIDHLIISRGFSIYLLETKNFACDVTITGQGEFTVEYGRKRWGIPSPIEQSKRHEVILARVLDRLGITGRTQSRPKFHHVVMFTPRAVIKRPRPDQFDTSHVIKADQFASWREKFVERHGALDVLGIALNMRSLDTIRAWGELLKTAHRPADQLALPDFIKPPAPQQLAPSASVNTDAAAALKRRLICATCQQKISFPEGKFCWNNEHRFGGLQYCRAHQTAFP